MNELDRLRSKHKFSLFACVVMPDHAHLLLWTNQSFLPTLMEDWKRTSGFQIAKARRRKGSIWQRRYFDFVLRRAADFGEKFEYIHNNPVAAGLVAHPEDWPWSTASFYSKKNPSLIAPDPFDLPPDPNEPLWPAPWR
ncbi:MAG: transposase [Candidatus Acidiferrales bacterium]